MDKWLQKLGPNNSKKDNKLKNSKSLEEKNRHKCKENEDVFGVNFSSDNDPQKRELSEVNNPYKRICKISINEDSQSPKSFVCSSSKTKNHLKTGMSLEEKNNLLICETLTDESLQGSMDFRSNNSSENKSNSKCVKLRKERFP